MTCYTDEQCFHVGTCCEQACIEWDPDHSARCIRYQTCVCDPVDAASYPDDSEIYFVARFQNYSHPNIHTVFEDPRGTITEDTFDMESGWAWGYVSYPMGGWHGKITSELRDGTTVKETITTYSGTGPIGRIREVYPVGDVLVGETIKIYCDIRNVGEPSPNSFKVELVNSDTGEKYSAITPDPVSCKPDATVVFGMTLPSTSQTVNLRCNVYLIEGDNEILHDYDTMTLNIANAQAKIDVDWGDENSPDSGEFHIPKPCYFCSFLSPRPQ